MFRIGNHISYKQLVKLCESDNQPCVSVYFSKGMTHIQEKQKIALKNTLSKIQKKFEKYDVNPIEAEKIMDRLNELFQNPSFWQITDMGIAIFADAENIHVFRFDADFKTVNYVDTCFYIRPILPLYHNGENQLVALMGQDDISLTLFARGEQKDVEMPELIQSLDNFLQYHDFEAQQQFHTEKPSETMFHGHGGKHDKANIKKYRKEYYKAFKNWVKDQLGNDQKLYIAGDSESFGMIKKVAGKEFKVEHLINKNSHSIDEHELLMNVIGIQRAILQEIKQKELENLKETNRKVLYSIEEIVPAAIAKRIKALFIPANNDAIWGHYQPDRHSVVIESEQDRSLGEELINRATIETLLNNGLVFSTKNPKEKNLPRFAAVCRW